MSSFSRRIRVFFGRYFFLAHPHLKTPFLISCLITTVLALAVAALYFPLQPQVPLFYSLAQPQDFLVPKIWLILFPLASLFVTLFHFSLIRVLRTHEPITRELFAWASVVIQVVFAIGLIRILLVIM